MEAMERLMAGRTTFMIAHRLSTTKACSLWLRLERGHLVEVTESMPGDVRDAVVASPRALARRRPVHA